MKAKFTGTPDVSALNDLGAWFGEQKNYTCAAEAFATSLQMDPKQKDMPHVAFMFGASLYLRGRHQRGDRCAAGSREIRLQGDQAAPDTCAGAGRHHATPDAEAEWRAALDIDPEYTYALDNLSDDLLADHDNEA